MKDAKKIKSIVAVIVLLLIGIFIIVFNKFSFNVNYSKNVRLEFDLGKEYAISDILLITNEVYNDQIPIVRKAGIYQETVDIILEQISDEKNEELINKINEKFETELTIEDINIYYNSNLKGRDLIKPFIVPGIIAFVLILVFYGIRYNKLGLFKVLAGVTGIGVGTQILYLSLLSIFEMQINEATIAVGITIVLFCFMYLIATFEKQLKNA